MKRGTSLFATMVAATCTGAQALAADDPIVLQPVTEWAGSADAEGCTLTRDFGTPESRTQLQFRQSSLDESYFVTITSSNLKPVDPGKLSTEEKIRYRFDPQQEWLETTSKYSFKGSDFSGAIFQIKVLPPDSLWIEAAKEIKRWRPTQEQKKDREKEVQAAMDSTTSFSIRNAFTEEISLNTDSLRTAFALLRGCVNGVIADWGYDPLVVQNWSRLPKPINVDQIARNLLRTFPAEDSITFVRLAIDEQGKTVDCHIQLPVQERFEKQACREFRGMRFEPALDADGNEVESFFITQVTFLTYQ